MDSKFLTAVRNHDIRLARELLDNGADVNTRHYHGESPLGWAARHGYLEMMELLLGRDDVNVNIIFENRTPLSVAAEEGHKAVVELLLQKHGVDLNHQDTDGRTPIYLAASAGHEAVVELLLAQKGVDPSLRDSMGRTPLHRAVKYEAVISLLLRSDDLDVNARDTYGQTPIYLAASYGHEALVELLLAHKEIDLNLSHRFGGTPLHRAVKYEAVIRLLLMKDNLDVNARNNDGRTPISFAAEKGYQPAVDLLAGRKDLQPDVGDSEGRTPLSWAAGRGHETVAKTLLDRSEVDPNSEDIRGRTPLSWAAGNGYEGIVRLLLSRVSNPASKDRFGRTALTWAAERGSREVAKLLLEESIFEADSKDNFGRTPLFWAAGQGHAALVQALLKEGVDPRSQDHFGLTPASWAKEQGQDSVAQLLISTLGGKGSSLSETEVRYTGYSRESYVGEGFSDLDRELPGTWGPQTMKLRINWHVPQAMRLYPKRTDFSSILAITGDEGDAQIASCGAYLAEHFPHGDELLDALQTAWGTGNHRYNPALSVTLERFEGSERQIAVIEMGGASRKKIATAFVWFCCAVRPANNGNLCLSNFQFCIHYTSYSEESLVEVQIVPLQTVTNEKRRCWWDLFNNAVIVHGGPISDRSQFVKVDSKTGLDLSRPEGLEIPFDIMVELAAVNYPFEYDKGILLKGFSTLLVATGIWKTSNGTAVQWHFVESKDDLSLSKYTDDAKYHIFAAGEESGHFNTVKNARAFLGWCDAYRLQLAGVDLSNIKVTRLKNSRTSLELKEIGINAGFQTTPLTGAAVPTYSVQRSSVRHTRELAFNQMIGSSDTAPILLYEPNERRGWLVPLFSVLECMALINQHKYKTSVDSPTSEWEPDDVKEILLERLQNSDLKNKLNGPNKKEADKNTYRLAKILSQVAVALDWAGEHARHQNRIRAMMPRNKIYGLELYKIALRDKYHEVKECKIDSTHGGWIKLLDQNAIKGVVFCSGLGDVMVCDSATLNRCANCAPVPQKHCYLAAAIPCLRDLTDHGDLPSSSGWKFRAAAFNPCGNQSCVSWTPLLQNFKDSCNDNPSMSHEQGFVVFGKPPR